MSGNDGKKSGGRGKAIKGFFYGSKHDSQQSGSGRKDSSSEDTKNSHGSKSASSQLGGAVANPKPAGRGAGASSRGDRGAVGQTTAGGNHRSKGQQQQQVDTEMPAHMKTSHVPPAGATSTAKVNITTSSTKTSTSKSDESGHYKAEYRKLKSENEDIKATCETLTKAIEAKDAEINKLSKFMEDKALEFCDLEGKLKKAQDDAAILQDKYSRSTNEQFADLKLKSAEVEKLTSEVRNYEELLQQARDKNLATETEYTKLVESSEKIQEKVKKFSGLRQRYSEKLKAVEEEKQKMQISCDEEIAKREDAEQKLANANSDLAKFKADSDEGYCVVETENGEGEKKIKELQDVIKLQTSEMSKMKTEMENSKEALEKNHEEVLQQMKCEHQQLVLQLEDVKNQNGEYEKVVKTLEARAESAEKSLNWSVVKVKEGEGLMKQLEDTVAEQNSTIEALKKEKEDVKVNLKKKHEQLAAEILKLQGYNNQLQQTIENSNVKIGKMELEMSQINSELAETREFKLLLEKKLNEESAVQTNVGLDDHLQKLINEKAVLENQMMDGYKEREDRIAELDEFIKDQVNEFDKMETAFKQAVADKQRIEANAELADKELNEAIQKRQEELESLRLSCQQKDEEIDQLHQSLSGMSSEETNQLQEELAKAKKELSAKEEEIKQLNDTTTKQSISFSEDSQYDVDQLLKESEGQKQTFEQLYTSYQKLKTRLENTDEKLKTSTSQCSELQTQLDQKEIELSEMRQETESISGLRQFVEDLHEKVVMAKRDTDKPDEKESWHTMLNELGARVVEMRNDKKLLTTTVDRRDVEIAEKESHIKDLESRLAQQHSRVVTVTAACSDVNRSTELQQGGSLLHNEGDQIVTNLKDEKREAAELVNASSKTGVGDPNVEHADSGGVGDLPELAGDNGDSATMKELTRELETEKKAVAAAQEMMNQYAVQVQELQSKCKSIVKQMQAGYKEREDRIAELDEFIKDQVTEFDKMETAFKQAVADKQVIQSDLKNVITSKGILEKEHKKLLESYESANQVNKQLKESNKQLKESQEKLVFEVSGLRSTNENLSREVGRLMTVDQQLTVAKQEITETMRKAEEEMATQTFLIQTYKEDFEQERKDRQNAHHIKEQEIEKVRVEMEALKADHHENLQSIRDNYETKLQTYQKNARQYAQEKDKVTKDYANIVRQLNQYTEEIDKLSKENTKLHTALEKEKKEAQGKVDLYKNKTEQFQVQWKKREEVEKVLQGLKDELNTQRRLNTQQQSTIDDLLRKNKGIDPKIPNVSGASVSTRQYQHHQSSPHGTPFQSMSSPAGYPADQRPSKLPLVVSPNYSSQHDPTVAPTNADMAHYAYQQHQQQDAWQKEQQLQHYQMNQQPQNNLQLKGRGRGMFPNQPIRPVGDTYGGGAQYAQKHLPPPAPDHFGGQPMSLGSRQRDYTAGTNAAPQQDMYPAAETHRAQLGNPPMSLDSFRSKQQTPLVSEGINEEIRYQADLQRKQPSEEFESGIAYDPYLICPKCKRQFREGQVPEYRHHIDNCRHQQ